MLQHTTFLSIKFNYFLLYEMFSMSILLLNMTKPVKPKTGRRPTGKITFPLRIYPETKTRLEKAAERNRIPLSEFVERTLLRQLDRDGIE